VHSRPAGGSAAPPASPVAGISKAEELAAAAARTTLPHASLPDEDDLFGAGPGSAGEVRLAAVVECVLG
jgi:hypothetical protein